MKLPNYAIVVAFLVGTVAGQAINHFTIAQTAFAQSVPPAMAAVIATCGTPPGTYAANTFQPMTQNTNGELCVNQ